jgi:transcriptional regulator with XRE-family HTH domain
MMDDINEGPYFVAVDNGGAKLFGELVKLLRNTNRLSIGELAKRACISHEHLRQIEKGGRAPSLEIAKAIVHQVGAQWVVNHHRNIDGPIQLLVVNPSTDKNMAFVFSHQTRGRNKPTEAEIKKATNDEQLRTIALEAAAITHHRDNTWTPEMVVQTATRYLRFLKEGE